jgi:quercetin dioxygenase-like cupin family protein
MIKAYKLYTGSDGGSHFETGSIHDMSEDEVLRTHFKETAPHSVYDWHNAPEEQYVISLRGTLEFTMPDGTSFILRPGEVVLALDTTGAGHKWRMLGDEPWQRAYVVLKAGKSALFVPDGHA